MAAIKGTGAMGLVDNFYYLDAVFEVGIHKKWVFIQIVRYIDIVIRYI